MKNRQADSSFLARLRQWLELLTRNSLFDRSFEKTGKSLREGEMHSRRKILRHEPLEERQLLAVDVTGLSSGAFAIETLEQTASYSATSLEETALVNFDSTEQAVLQEAASPVACDVTSMYATMPESMIVYATVPRLEDMPWFREFQPVMPEIDPAMEIAQLQFFNRKQLDTLEGSSVNCDEEFFPDAREHGNIRPLEFVDNALADHAISFDDADGQRDNPMMLYDASGQGDDPSGGNPSGGGNVSGGEFSVGIYWSTFSGGATSASGGIFADKSSPTQSGNGYKQFRIYVTGNNTTQQNKTVDIEALDIVNWALPNAGTIIENEGNKDNRGGLTFSATSIVFAPGESEKYITVTVDGNAYAGDNWIFRATYDDGTTSGGTNDSGTFTVWRRLWVECDRMAMPGYDIEYAPLDTVVETYFKSDEKGVTWDDVVPENEPDTFDLHKQPDKPDISLLNTLMNRACVEVLEYQYNANPVVDFVPNLSQNQTTYEHESEFANQPGNRSVPAPHQVDESYWTMYVLGAYEFSLEDHDNHTIAGLNLTNVAPAGGSQCRYTNGINAGNAYVFCETIRDVIHAHKDCHGIVTTETGPLADYGTFFSRVVAHEILHNFLGPHVNPFNSFATSISDQTIMNYNYHYLNWDCSLNVEQIQKIQSMDKPIPAQ